jgi:hypothetical protein
LQLKKGQYRAELAIRLAEDILPTEIKERMNEGKLEGKRKILQTEKGD